MSLKDTFFLNTISSDIIAIIVIALIIIGALIYIIKAKLNGQKCIGCPHSKTCKSNRHNEEKGCSCCGGCCSSQDEK